MKNDRHTTGDMARWSPSDGSHPYAVERVVLVGLLVATEVSGPARAERPSARLFEVR
jgi:hypothetical protein